MRIGTVQYLPTSSLPAFIRPGATPSGFCDARSSPAKRRNPSHSGWWPHYRRLLDFHQRSRANAIKASQANTLNAPRATAASTSARERKSISCSSRSSASLSATGLASRAKKKWAIPLPRLPSTENSPKFSQCSAAKPVSSSNSRLAAARVLLPAQYNRQPGPGWCL